jgi:hypothetical protein
MEGAAAGCCALQLNKRHGIKLKYASAIGWAEGLGITYFMCVVILCLGVKKALVVCFLSEMMVRVRELPKDGESEYQATIQHITMPVRFMLAIMDDSEHRGQWQCASKCMELGSFGTMTHSLQFWRAASRPNFPSQYNNNNNMKAKAHSNTLKGTTKSENLCQYSFSFFLSFLLCLYRLYRLLSSRLSYSSRSPLSLTPHILRHSLYVPRARF